ncbi:hypothetical protein [Pantoea allii]|uniref:hypothetical protein n=1 Tax=Pantoea allii TaxID=574096 RepID=UPI003D312236
MKSFKTFEMDESFIKSKHCMKNDILAACIGYRSKSEEYGYIRGFSEEKGNGYAILLWFYSKLFGDLKLPVNNDRNYFIHKEDVDKTIKSLNELQLNEVMSELKEIYNGTQKALRDVGVSHINLRREIAPGQIRIMGWSSAKISPFGIFEMDYSGMLMLCKASAEVIGRKTIPVFMDVINSFTDTNDKGGYGSISLELSIPTEDVLYSHLNFRTDEIEGEEWVILNRSPTGMVELPVSSIVIIDKEVESFYKNCYSNIDIDLAYQTLSQAYSKTWSANYSNP